MTFALSCLAFSFNTFFDHHLAGERASLVAQLVKNPPAVWETLGLILELERSPGEGWGRRSPGEVLPTRVLWSEEFHG